MTGRPEVLARADAVTELREATTLYEAGAKKLLARLTSGRYVGVASPEEDEDFDFEQTLRDIHVEAADLNKEAVELATKIQANFEKLGI